MHRSLLAACLLACLTQPALGATISNLTALTQPEFQAFSQDLASALSYKPLAPAQPLGAKGFDMGLEVTRTGMSQSEASWAKITQESTGISSLTMPKLHVTKGLPFGIDVGVVYGKVPASNISVLGAELRYALLPGGIAHPALAIRAAVTRLKGVDQLALGTRSVDLSISQGFAMFTPYAGIGNVWTNSTPNAGPSLQEVSFTERKVFFGANLNLTFANLAAEVDKTGPERSISLKAGFRF